MAIEFDSASTESINCGSGASIDNVWDGGGSVAFWVKFIALPGDGANDRLCGSSASSGWLIQVIDVAGATAFDNSLRLFHTWSGNDGDWRGPDNGFAAGVWYHVVVLYNADAATNDPAFYVNGSSVAVTEVTAPTTARDSDAAANKEIAAVGGVEPSNIQVEDFRMYKGKTLTAEEVAALAAGYRGPLGGESLWYSMSDAQAVTHWDGDSLATTDVIPDMSGNGNDGTPTNTPTARASEAPRFGALLG